MWVGMKSTQLRKVQKKVGRRWDSKRVGMRIEM
jgi:hypothetical protein